jgi:heme/copper-type cytochrome/quinol oxidase subunit 2
MRIATALLVIFLLVLLGGTGWFVFDGMTVVTDAQVSTHGYIAMALGVTFSLVIGVALMVLLFYSSRYGYDEPARSIRSDDAPHPGSEPSPH